MDRCRDPASNPMTGTNPGQTRVNSNLNNKSARLRDSGKRKSTKKTAAQPLTCCYARKMASKMKLAKMRKKK